MTDGQGIVLPEPSELTQPFWDACQDDRLVVQQCTDCNTKFFTPLPACPACQSQNWSWAESPGTGTLYSFTVVHRPAQPDRPVPYVIGIVDLDDGWTMLSNIVDCDFDTLHCSQKVDVRYVATESGSKLPMFTPST